jgi:hypothetical protein
MKTCKLIGLVAVITYVTEKRGRRDVVVGSNVFIALKTSDGNKGVASARLGGNYNQEQALKEFTKNKKRFQLIEPGHTLAVQAGMA